MMYMKKWLLCALLLGSGLHFPVQVQAYEAPRRPEYVIVASYRVSNDPEWRDVIAALKKKHKGAEVCYYKESPREALGNLRWYNPRYVAVVEKPEQIGRDFVVDLNRMSREVDDDIYADFLCGIVTGYDAQAALRLVNDTEEPKVLRTALSTVSVLGDGHWFDSFAYISDARPGLVGEREKGQTKLTETLVTDSIDNRMFRDMIRKAQESGKQLRLPKDFSVSKPNLLKRFCDYYAKYDPDVIITASHATEKNLEMPFSSGNLMCRDGKLYADFPDAPTDLTESGKTRVYLPVGNCLMGNIDNTKNSMAVAFMNSAHVGMLAGGYVVETWYGRNGWGGLCYFMNNPGRYTIPEAFYLNQQDMMFQLRQMAPDLVNKPFPFAGDDPMHVEREYAAVAKMNGGKITTDAFGFFYDRDVVALYGDPAWDVRLAEQPNPNDYEVSCKVKSEECVVTIKTGPNYSEERLRGSDFRSQHVGELPFSFFFPKRLRNPRLAEGQNWQAAVDENFLLVYKPGFEPNKKYTIVLTTDPVR